MIRYEIEVWDKNAKPLANITQFCSNICWSKKLNDSETLSFDIDLGQYERLISTLNYTKEPFSFIDAGTTDIRMKRNGVYVLGCSVEKITYQTQDPSVNMHIECVGYLNYFKNRYVTATYTDVPQADIIFGLMNECKEKPNGDYGVTMGAIYGDPKKRERTYTEKCVRDAMVQMSEVIDGIDFEFAADKSLSIWNTKTKAKGTKREDVRLLFPGNIDSFQFNRSITKVANAVKCKGAQDTDTGETLTAFSYSEESAERLYRREKISTYQSVINEDVLQEHADSLVHYLEDIIELPKISISNGYMDLSEVTTGDSIYVKFSGYESLKHIDGYYRIGSINVSVDENMSENVSIEFDDYDIESIMSGQDE